MLPNVNVVNRYLYTITYGIPTTNPINMGDCVTFNPTVGQFGEVSHTLEEDNGVGSK